MRLGVLFSVLVAAMLMAAVPVLGPTWDQATDPSSPVQHSTAVPLAHQTMALAGAMAENLGQFGDPDVLFHTLSGGAAFARDSVILQARSVDGDAASTVRLTFLDANGVMPVGREQEPWRSSYFIGPDPESWHTGIRNYREIVYPDLWDGIHLMCRGMPGGVKYEFVVQPGVDHGNVVVGVSGHQGLSTEGDGSLRIGTGLGPGSDIFDTGLDVFYADDPTEKIPASFVISGPDSYTFSLEVRDMSRAVIIDPLVYFTFLGGAGMDSATAVAVGPDGCAYVTGHTESLRFGPGPGSQRNGTGDHDAFVLKLAPDGASVIYAAFLGGLGYDSAHAIAADSAGHAYLTGVTFSPDFPVTDGALFRTYGGVGDAFVVKMGETGDTLVYSTYLGGGHDDAGHGIAVDDRGQAHVVGLTWSRDFPVTQGAFCTAPIGDADAFVAKLSDTGDYMVYSTYLGGPGSDWATSVTLDAAGNAYVAGVTSHAGFPVTPGALNNTVSGTNAFVTKFGQSGNEPIYSAVLGGSGSDHASCIAVDESGFAFVAGHTDSADFPASAGSPKGGRDVFVAGLNLSGDSLAGYVTLGGRLDDMATGISVGSGGEIFVAGLTDSADFPVTTGAMQQSHGGGRDGFLLMLNSTHMALAYSSFLGGSLDDRCLGLSLSLTDCPFVSGDTMSPDFPVAPSSPLQPHGGGRDGFLVKLDIIAPVAMAGPDMAVNESAPFTFNGTASTDNEAIVNYTWSFDDGPDRMVLHGPAPKYVFSVPGVYLITLTVADAVGNIGTDTMAVTVLEYPFPVAVPGSDLTVPENTAAILNGSASRDNTGISSYVWSFHDGLNNASAAGPSPTWTFRVPGTYSVTLNVTDEDGNWDTASINVTVLDTTNPLAIAPPVMRISPGTVASFDAGASTDNIGIANYTWSFTHNGTGVQLHGSSQSFVFWEPGAHAVLLTVTDAAGNSASDTMVVTVADKGAGAAAMHLYAGISLLTASALLLALSIFRRRRPGTPGAREVGHE